jgi:hypothetical protein
MLYNYRNAFPYWQPYAPYLVNGSVLFLVAAAAIVNIFPSASIGRSLHTGRFLFHHYVYGLIVLVFSAIYVVAFTPVPLLYLFVVYNSNIAANAGRFFVLAGFTLVLDDLPDVSKRVESALNKLKAKACQGRVVIHWLTLFMGGATFYVFLAVSLWTTKNPALAVPASFVIGSFLVTSITSFVCVQRKVWLHD